MASKQLWRWHGITGDGNAQDGMLWAESRTLLLMALQQQMVTPLSLKRIAINSAQWRGDKSAEVIHQLATLLKAGLTLSEGLALLAEQHPSKQWQALLQSLAHDLEQGIAFSNALLPWSEVFPPLYQAMIRTGELTGKLDECCFELARQQKSPASVDRQSEISVTLSHHHFSDGNHGGCGNAAFCSAGVCRYL